MRLYSYKDPFHFRWIIHKSCRYLPFKDFHSYYRHLLPYGRADLTTKTSL